MLFSDRDLTSVNNAWSCGFFFFFFRSSGASFLRDLTIIITSSSWHWNDKLRFSIFILIILCSKWWRVWRVLLFTFCCVWWFLWFLFVYFCFAATQGKSDTRLFFFSFLFFGTYTHECTWTFTWFVCNGITAHILVSYSPAGEVRRRACYCVCVFGFVGCLMTGPITYLFSGFWVTLMCSANLRRVWVNGFPKQAIWCILFIDSALASQEQSWEAFWLYMSVFFEEIWTFLIQNVVQTLWW